MVFSNALAKSAAGLPWDRQSQKKVPSPFKEAQLLMNEPIKVEGQKQNYHCPLIAEGYWSDSGLCGYLFDCDSVIITK